MKKITLGKTGINTSKNAFGALPIQRVTKEYSTMLLKKAYNCGFTFFDTARSYSDSEEKIGLALSDVRENIFIATKTPSTTVDGFWKDLETSLSLLKTDYIDIYQFHNPSFCPRPGDGTGLYEAMLKACDLGKIRFIGITNHRLRVAEQAVRSLLYDTLQFPFSYLASDKDLSLIKLCKDNNIGVIGMKSLSGGLITKSDAAYAFLDQYDNVLPIWGIQRESELDEFISYMDNPPVLNDEIMELINKDRKELIGNFCRGCGYCMPCPSNIEINTCARMMQLIRRSPSENFLSEPGKNMMMNIENCVECGKCKEKCPYGLDTPNLLKKNLEDYKNILSKKVTL